MINRSKLQAMGGRTKITLGSRLLTVVALTAGMLPLVASTSYGVMIPKTLHTSLQINESEVQSASARSLPFQATHLGIGWRGTERGPEIRTSPDRESWSAWEPVIAAEDVSRHEEGIFNSSLIGGEDARWVEIRTPPDVAAGVSAGEPAEDTAKTIVLSAINTEDGPKRFVRVEAQASAALDQPRVISRSAWGADESLRKDAPRHASIQKMFVHHTVTDNNDPDPAATMRAIYSYHTQTLGWDDIGYNFVIDDGGNIYEGRFARSYAAGEVPTGEDVSGKGVIGAHVYGHNTGSVGIALLGDFRYRAPSSIARSALEELLAWKADRHSIDPAGSDPYYSATFNRWETFPNIAGHRDADATACPGDLLYDQLPNIRAETAARIAGDGYWMVAADGGIFSFGGSKFFGSMGGKRLNAPVVGMVPTPSGRGYWLVASDGGIFTFGDAGFHGSMGGKKLNAPILSMAATSSGNGYWLVAADGGIFSFGDAPFFGSTGSMKLNKPVVGMAPTSSGSGYWLVASDGGIFAFGDAAFYGSTGSMKLNKPVVGMSHTSGSDGYWLVASDGGIFAFGAARFYGSMGGQRLNAGVLGMASSASGKGYWLVASDGGIFTFGDAPFYGSMGSSRLNAPVLAMAGLRG